MIVITLDLLQEPHWKESFFGDLDNYDRLLNMKKAVDPDHILCCHFCVGYGDYGDCR